MTIFKCMKITARIPRKAFAVGVLVIFFIPSYPQGTYWITDDSYLIREDYGLTGFDKINETEWRIKEFGDCCYKDPECNIEFDACRANGKDKYGGHVGSPCEAYYYSMPCLRDHILSNYENGQETTWGILVEENQENDSLVYPWSDQLTYTGSWKISTSYVEGNCNCAYSMTPGDYVQFTFEGTGIKLFTEKLQTHGSAKIYIDGELKETVTLSSESRINPFVIEYSLPEGTHTIRFEVSENKPVVLLGFELNEPVECIPDTVYIEKTDTIYVEKTGIKEYSSVRKGYWKIRVNGMLLDNNFALERTATGRATYLKYLKPDDIVEVIPPEYEIE